MTSGDPALEFGELRSFFQRERPSAGAFARLVALLMQAEQQLDGALLAQLWLPYAAQHLARWPVDARTISDVSGAWDARSFAWLALVRGIIAGEEGVAPLSAWLDEHPHRFDQVELLDLSHSKLSDLDLTTMFSPGRLPSLRTLNLSSNHYISAAALRALIHSPLLSHLDLSFTTQGAEALKLICRDSRFYLLHWLDLTSSFACGGLGLLEQTKHLSLLQTLKLGANQLVHEDIVSLAQAPYLDALSALSLEHNALSDEEVELLCDAAFLPGLVALDLSSNALTCHGARALAAVPWRALRSLDLSANAIFTEGAAALFAAPQLYELTQLELGNKDRSSRFYNRISGEALAPLASAEIVAWERLDLGENPIGEVGARYLAQSEALLFLQSLDLSGCQLGPDGCGALAQGCFPSLRQLDLSHQRLDDGTLEALSRATWAPRLEGLSFSLSQDIHDEIGVVLRPDEPSLGALEAAFTRERWPSLRQLTVWALMLPKTYHEALVSLGFYFMERRSTPWDGWYYERPCAYIFGRS